MCIAIWKPQGIELTEETLANCWNRNPDGAGFMYSENNKLHVVKGLMSYDEFVAAYAPHSDKNAALHFRIATHGGVNPENTHPFQIHDDLAMVHNGIISNVKIHDNGRSDTWHFTELYLKKFHTMWKEPEFQDLVESYIGHSKLILMDNTGEVKIYKENLGKWDSDCWFSNTSYETPVYQAPKQYYNSYTKSPWNKADTKKTAPLKMGDIVYLVYRTLFTDPTDPNKGVWINAYSNVVIQYFTAGTTVSVQDPVSKYTAVLDVWKLELADDVEEDAWMFTKQELEESKFISEACSLPSQYKKGDNVVFTKNYNHFRVGEIIIVDDVLKNYVLTRKPNGQFYSVPNHTVEPFGSLLM